MLPTTITGAMKNKDQAKMIRRLVRDYNFVLEGYTGGHAKLRAPNGQKITVSIASKDAGAHRATAKHAAKLLGIKPIKLERKL
jgi:predicted RNA binding protein YcfA (HicA-like mRNA interferase family)